MKQVEIYARVRHAVLIEGISERAAAARFGINARTVSKMLKFSVPPGYVRAKPPFRPKLDAFIAIIDAILAADKERPKKQRHTAKRIFERLRDEHGFTGKVTIVKDYVAGWRERHQEMFVPLVHPPGHAQVDFGEAIGVIGGVERKIHFLAMDLPHSDAIFVVGYPAETTEAFCDGHVRAFVATERFVSERAIESHFYSSALAERIVVHGVASGKVIASTRARFPEPGANNGIEFLIAQNPNGTTKSSFTRFPIRAHERGFKVVLALPKRDRMIELEIVRHLRIKVLRQGGVRFDGGNFCNSEVRLPAAPAGFLARGSARFVVDDPISNSGASLGQIGLRKMVSDFRQVIVSRDHLGREYGFRHGTWRLRIATGLPQARHKLKWTIPGNGGFLRVSTVACCLP